jgi:DNA excision repair protein ERCC-5
MGVTGLWTVVAPTARPTPLPTLAQKRLAVDASIWIYQFLKAVRDKEGNALRNSHVVGFFRRICKLLFYGVKPVFVFDGGAPILKRETVRGRARRREGRREDAVRTAGKLLALQMGRVAEEEDRRRNEVRERSPLEEELPDEGELVYVEEIGQTAQERQRTRGEGFKRKDQYHLPDLDVSIENMGAPNDPRIMSQAELEEYARQFHSGEEIDFYDFSKIDFESPFFLSLPPGDRYNILNAARLRSRLRMGHSKEQLDAMFPDRMAFSKFQIERVKERNELTQRLMHLNGGADMDYGGRIAGEKDKEYVLVKNDGVEGGWALGVVSNRQGSKRDNAIDLEAEDEEDVEQVSSASEDEFEDVAIEGLNRIPKQWQRKRRKSIDFDPRYHDAAEHIARKRREVYEARKAAAAPQIPLVTKPAPPTREDSNDLFVQQEDDEEADELFEDVAMNGTNEETEDHDEDLDLAIALSLQQSDPVEEDEAITFAPKVHSTKGSNTFDTPLKSKGPFEIDDDDLDLQAALAESRTTKYTSKTSVRLRSPVGGNSLNNTASASGFAGILPFESLNLGQSLLGKKKSKKIEEENSGGFEKNLGQDTYRKERPAQPMPSWFNAAPSTKDLKQDDEGARDDEYDDKTNRYDPKYYDRNGTVRRQDSKKVVDLDASQISQDGPIVVSDDSDDESVQEQTRKIPEVDELPEDVLPAEDEKEVLRRKKEAEEREKRYKIAQEIADANQEEEEDLCIDDLAERAQAHPLAAIAVPDFTPDSAEKSPQLTKETSDADEDVDWSDSEPEDASGKRAEKLPPDEEPAGGLFVSEGEEEDVDFEDVPAKQPPSLRKQQSSMNAVDIMMTAQYIDDIEEQPTTGSTAVNGPSGPANPEENYFSDSDEELMRSLAIEAEEHARFASSLNKNKDPAREAADFEAELKGLRNQQKKDRRDADEVTQTMVQECQALLRLFGLPYITAPMEAEAQCAELVHLGLVDGIVTDDSDIFLFGGTRVYKNMFNAAKFVECYLASDLEKEYALDRHKLIRFAHLLGSDYTEGIPGVGPVTALEILTDFPTLQEFSTWCEKVQLSRPQDLEGQLTTPFRRKFRNTAQKRMFLPKTFPDLRVDDAYLHPDVDSDPQPFQWGVPDLDRLRSFLMATIGWSQERTDEILVPVVRDMNRRVVEGTQANITKFFTGAVGVGGNVEGARLGMKGKESGRMKTAYKRLRGEAERRRRGSAVDEDVDADDVEEEVEESSTTTSKIAKEKLTRKPRKAKKRAIPESPADGTEGEDDADVDELLPSRRPRKAAKRAKKPKKRIGALFADSEDEDE